MKSSQGQVKGFVVGRILWIQEGRRGNRRALVEEIHAVRSCILLPEPKPPSPNLPFPISLHTSDSIIMHTPQKKVDDHPHSV